MYFVVIRSSTYRVSQSVCLHSVVSAHRERASDSSCIPHLFEGGWVGGWVIRAVSRFRDNYW